MKKKCTLALAALLVVSSFPLSSCGKSSGNVLRVASWDEYIDEGDSEAGTRALYEEFEDWYEQEYGKEIKIEYVALQDNETMYNKIKMGDKYDLLCPSEYMMMKMLAEGRLEKYPESFFLTDDPNYPHNYYAKNVSPYIKGVFDKGANGNSWTEYIAGYMWGTTGFIYNPEEFSSPDIFKSWTAFTNKECKRNITAKDNVRDSYFAALGLYYEQELLALKAAYERGDVTLEAYQSELSRMMNDTSAETIKDIQNKRVLKNLRENLYGLETDEGKMDIVMGRFGASYQWSGDAVYVLDVAEEQDDPLYLEYSIPEAASNIWFDGWVMMKGANVEAATAFVNFLSIPENAKRNMEYIGYTSCIGGDLIFDYVKDLYEADETETDVVPYDLSYFFGENHIFNVPAANQRRQVFVQYPDFETTKRLVVMNYFDKATNEKLNRMWITIK